MAREDASADQLLLKALTELPSKPEPNGSQSDKRRWSELLSEAVAYAVAQALRDRGLREALPSVPGDTGVSGAERRMSGGIGAKKVDVTWATAESGLVLGASIKSINFKDNSTNNYQKNLTNRRGDMLFEAVTLHRRFPYSTLLGLFFLDVGAASDGTETRKSTFYNAHDRFRLFTNRSDPHGREEQYERFYFIVHNANRFDSTYKIYPAGNPEIEVGLSEVLDETLKIVADRNPDFYQFDEGRIIHLRT